MLSRISSQKAVLLKWLKNRKHKKKPKKKEKNCNKSYSDIDQHKGSSDRYPRGKKEYRKKERLKK